MKYFGEYLVSKGIITEEILINAIFHQTRLIPTVAEIVFKKRLISPSQVLGALKIQHEKKIDFKTACQHLALWTDELERHVYNEIKQNTMPLGQILISSGAIDLTTITKALDEFLSQVEIPQQNTASSSEVEAVTCTIESLITKTAMTVKNIDPILLEEVFSNLTPSKFDSINTLLLSMENLKDRSKLDAVQSLVKEIHFIRGLLRCIRFDKMESLITLLEDYSLKVSKKLHLEPSFSLKLLSGYGIEVIAIIQNLVQTLHTNPSEIIWFHNESNYQRFNKCFKAIADSCLGEIC